MLNSLENLDWNEELTTLVFTASRFGLFCFQRNSIMKRQRVIQPESSSSDDDVPPTSTRPRVRVKKASPKRKGITLALTSGVFASFAGTFGKFAINQTETLVACEQVSNNHLHYSLQDSYAFCETVRLVYL
jgi:hypothetical protein